MHRALGSSSPRVIPEIVLENMVVEKLHTLFPDKTETYWLARSQPLGAGLPDIIATWYAPQLQSLAKINLKKPEILTYLRLIGRARLETIAQRLNATTRSIQSDLIKLADAGVISCSRDTFSLISVWKEILTEVVAIEVKTEKWLKAVDQAARNQIFSHRSFVALPTRLAQRIRREPIFQKLGLGLIAVDQDGSVEIIRKARRSSPKVYWYYYELALLIARDSET